MTVWFPVRNPLIDGLPPYLRVRARLSFWNRKSSLTRYGRSVCYIVGMTRDDQEHHSRRSLAAVAFLVIVAIAGAMLFANFLHNVAMMKCVTAGRQDCETR